MFRKLKCRMFEMDITQDDVGEAIGKSRGYVSLRMMAKRSFTLSDVYAICDLLEIPFTEIADFFPLGGKAKKEAA